jgi:hypothetical protein
MPSIAPTLLQIQLESAQLKRSTISVSTEKRIANALQADQCEEKQFFTEDLIRSVTFTAAEDEPRERLIRSRARATIPSWCNCFPATKAPSKIGPACSTKHEAVQRLNAQMPQNHHQH